MRRSLLVALLASSVACSDGDEREPPVFRVLSPLLLTFEGQQSAVSVDVDRRARFSVIDPDGLPRGTFVAEQAGQFQVPFDPSRLPRDVSTTLSVVAASDSGGRAQSSFTVRHGALGLDVRSGEIYDAALLTNGRIILASPVGVFLQTGVGSPIFDGPLAVGGSERRVVAAGPEGDAFAAGDDDEVLHYDSTGELCDRIEILPTEVSAGAAQPPSAIVDLATLFGGGSIEVAAAHDLGFSGFSFSGLPCASNGCADVDECPLDPADGFSMGTVLCLAAPEADYRATAVATQGDRIYTGGYTFTVRQLADNPADDTSVCVNLGLPAFSDPIAAIAVSQSSVWIAVAHGISRLDQDFAIGGGVARPTSDRYGDGRTAADGLDVLPDFDVRTMTPVAPGPEAADGVWFGTPSGFGRILRTESGAEIAWVSGRSLPGPSVRAILAPPDDPGLLWVATDDGLARLLLPAEL